MDFLDNSRGLFGVRYYDKFQANLGIAANILSDRLKVLVENGIFKKKQDDIDARRIKYRFTPKGMDIYTITLALMQWGDRYLSDDNGPPLTLYHKTCGQRLEPVMRCAHCGEAINARDIIFEDDLVIAEPGKVAFGVAKPTD